MGFLLEVQSYLDGVSFTCVVVCIGDKNRGRLLQIFVFVLFGLAGRLAQARLKTKSSHGDTVSGPQILFVSST